MPVRGGRSATRSPKDVLDGAWRSGITAARETQRIPATTSTATRARLPTIRLRLLASLHDMERRRHRVVVETAVFGTADRVVTGLQRLEPVRVRVARNDVNLEIKRYEPERVVDVERAKDDLDCEAGFQRESPGCVEGGEVPSRVEPLALGDVRDVEIPVPLVRVDLDDDIRILRDRIRFDQRLKCRDSDDHEDDCRDDGPDCLEAAVPGAWVRRPFGVPFAHTELQDCIEDEPSDERADPDRRDEDEVEQLLRRGLSGGDRVCAYRSSQECDQEGGQPHQAHLPEARHRLPKSDYL